MKLLLTNDDGINAQGLKVLHNAFKNIAEVTVVAPDVERSAVGHAITLNEPLRVEKIYKDDRFFGYAVDGTPADCVKIAVKAIMKEPPDIIFSGINLGPNLGINLIYSGTVSAAIEGAFYGITSVAISLTTVENPDFSYCAKFAVKLLGKIIENGCPRGTLLNVNVPSVPEDQIKGVSITRQGKAQFREYFDKQTDDQNRTYYRLKGDLDDVDEAFDADITAIKNNYISITPIHYDLTNYSLIKNLNKWKITK